MSFALLALFAAALFVNAGSPGPSIAALVARVLTGGLGAVVPFLAAMWIGEAMWLVAAVMGLGFVAAKFYLAFTILKYAGVGYLLYLAYRMWTAPSDVQASELPRESSAIRMFATGMALTIGNPKLMVFYLALLPSIIDVDRVSALGLTELVGVCIAVLMTTDLAWAFAAHWARRWFKSPRAIRIANRSSACAMGGAAALIATR